MGMKLYCFGESGNAYKCALALTLTGQDWEPVFVDFFNGETRSPAFRALNPMGEVPVLVDGDTVLTQSGVILDYISSKTGQLGGRSAAERREVLRWLFWDNHKLSTQVGTCRFLANFLPESKRPEGVIPFLQGRLKAAYTVLNDHLSTRDWIVGDEDGVVSFAHDDVDRLLQAVAITQQHEDAIKAEIATGKREQAWLHKVLSAHGL